MILAAGLRQTGERFFGNDQDVGGGLGADVFEGEAEVVFVDNIGGNFSLDDFAKNGVGHHVPLDGVGLLYQGLWMGRWRSLSIRESPP